MSWGANNPPGGPLVAPFSEPIHVSPPDGLPPVVAAANAQAAVIEHGQKLQAAVNELHLIHEGLRLQGTGRHRRMQGLRDPRKARCVMAPAIELCTCGHSHLSGGPCWCGCTVFTPDTEDDEYPVGEVQI